MWRSIGTAPSSSVDLQDWLRTDLKACTTCVLVVIAACSSKPAAPAKASPTYTLRKVTLPDLSHAAPSVQQQLRDGYARLEAKINGAATPTEELGGAYGQMGMLLMAAEYRGEAESA